MPTARHKALRLTWTRQHQHWTVNDWKHVTWSDESRLQLYRADGRVRVCRQPHQSMDPACQQGNVQADGGSVIVWGLCSWSDMRPLIGLDTTLTGDTYIRILADYQHPFMSIVNSDGVATGNTLRSLNTSAYNTYTHPGHIYLHIHISLQCCPSKWG